MNKIPKSRMKLSDYIRLGRISIKARKKSTKNTVFGMAFGLILLVPMIFFALAFYMDLAQQINSIRTASALSVSLKNINDKTSSIPYKPYTSDTEGQEGLPAFVDYYDLIDLPEIEDYILSEYSEMYFAYNNNIMMKMLLDGQTYELDFGFGNSGGGSQDIRNKLYGINKVKIVFPDESSSLMFTKAELDDYKTKTGRNSPLINICNDGFTASTNGAQEIIISEHLLKIWDIDKDDIANQTISIFYPKFKMGDYFGWYNIDNDTNPNNDIVPPAHDDPEHQLYFCYEFKVVGIIRDDFYDLPGKRDEAHFWVTSPSVYFKEGRQNFKPIGYRITNSDIKGNFITFEDNISIVKEKNIDDQYMLFLQSVVNRYTERYTRTGSSIELNHMQLQLQVGDYNMLAPVLSSMKTILKAAYNDVPANQFNYLFCNELYMQFSMIDQIGKILIIVFSAIGGIIFFTNMLNLLNTVRYSVESRKNYIGVMRAIGAKSKVIPRLYIFEMLIIFFKTFIRVVIFSTIFSYGIKLGLDKGFEYISSIVAFQINFLYFPMALGGIFLLTTFIGIFFARISSRLTAYQPILKTLYDEK